MKFQNRIDYVNIKAFDAGKVDLKNESMQVQGDLYETETKQFNHLDNVMLKKIGKFDEKAEIIKH